ncbi:MAG: TPM domain-containing protein [Xanthomonadales bacterium]|nr:TPM domain-containing protein [Xanthomonadales bacterium]
MVGPGRLWRHLFARPARTLFPADSLQRIAALIRASEARHRGEIVFALEADMPLHELWRNVSPRDRAVQAFSNLRVWNTAANNGVLIYLQLADRRIEIVADRGFGGLVSAEQWRGICQLMEERLAAGEPEAAVAEGIEAITGLLETHFPQRPGEVDEDELPDAPVILR